MTEPTLQDYIKDFCEAVEQARIHHGQGGQHLPLKIT